MKLDYQVLAIAICLVGAFGLATDAKAAAADFHELSLPARSNQALVGSDLLQHWRNLSRPMREEQVIKQLAQGNIPAFLRRLQPIFLDLITGETAIIFVTKDYLALGSEDDFLYTPLSLPAAQQAAELLGMSLPSRAVVDAIYYQARLQHRPIPLPPGPAMTKLGYFMQHQKAIFARVENLSHDQLAAGHKKDILNPRSSQDKQVTIYGWHRKSGKPIQPYSRVHGATYVDYSHGVRLLAASGLIAGKKVPLGQILNRALPKQTHHGVPMVAKERLNGTVSH